MIQVYRILVMNLATLRVIHLNGRSCCALYVHVHWRLPRLNYIYYVLYLAVVKRFGRALMALVYCSDGIAVER